MDVYYPEKYWAVYCKGCRETLRFADVQKDDPRLYPRVVALKCPRCGGRRRYVPTTDIFREQVNANHSFALSQPIDLADYPED